MFFYNNLYFYCNLNLVFVSLAMEKVFFISDIHLGAGSEADEQEKLRRLTTFLNFINQPGNQLYIVGDLFDFWFEYRHVIPNQYFTVLYRLHKLVENNITVHFLPGNHDRWIRNFFVEQVRIRVHPEIYMSEIHSKNILLFHGDGISKKDTGYRILKKIFRNPINIFLYRLLHPDLGIPLAKFMSAGSRKHTAGREFDDEPDYLKFAMEQFDRGIDYVIVGHSHKPLYRKIDNHILLNLGDWIHHFSYGRLEAGNLTLQQWNS